MIIYLGGFDPRAEFAASISCRPYSLDPVTLTSGERSDYSRIRNMKIKFGIMLKLFVWYFVLVSIFYGTIIVLFIHIRQIMKISENVVNKNFRISSASKKMIESLLWMEESQNKYDLIKKEDYKKYFISAQKEFEGNLVEILLLDSGGSDSDPWKTLYKDYLAQLPRSTEGIDEEEPSKTLWIPEEILNDWVQRISKVRSGNELAIESEMRILNDRGQMAVRLGFLGLGVSVLVGLLGSIFLAHSMNRPLRELRRGIRSIPQAGLSEPIKILSSDEFGELAGAFNEMAARLKEEERMRSDFISMLSHEVRTPLTSIRESVNLIAEEVMGGINDRQRRFLEIASREIERICDLLNHLMQVSRLEAGALEIVAQPVDPSTFVNSSISRVMPAAEAKGIKIHAQLPPDIPDIMGDPDHLQQVLLNLLGNAIKFSPSETEVVVRVEPDRNGSIFMLRFSICDSGPGIPEDEVSLVFNKYYRAEGTRDRIDGVGLGLSISKHIVEAHGGRVWVEGRPGGGSNFSFTIPTVTEA
jgi:signal transduction histidine kinase